jgi:hypothetical protein
MINEKEPARNRPDYIAFRTTEGGNRVVVIAALQPGDRGRFPWARWYSEVTPRGEFRQVPGVYVSLGIDHRIAKSMITIVQSGGSLPREVVSRLPVID